jgi:hypothetical protein
MDEEGRRRVTMRRLRFCSAALRWCCERAEDERSGEENEEKSVLCVGEVAEAFWLIQREVISFQRAREIQRGWRWFEVKLMEIGLSGRKRAGRV